MNSPRPRRRVLAPWLLLGLVAVAAWGQGGPSYRPRGAPFDPRFPPPGGPGGPGGPRHGPLFGPQLEELRSDVAWLVTRVPIDVGRRRAAWLRDTVLQIDDRLHSDVVEDLPHPMREGATRERHCMDLVAEALPDWLQYREEGAEREQLVHATHAVPPPCLPMVALVLRHGVAHVRERWHDTWSRQAASFDVDLSLPEEEGPGDGFWEPEEEWREGEGEERDEAWHEGEDEGEDEEPEEEWREEGEEPEEPTPEAELHPVPEPPPEATSPPVPTPAPPTATRPPPATVPPAAPEPPPASELPPDPEPVAAAEPKPTPRTEPVAAAEPKPVPEPLPSRWPYALAGLGILLTPVLAWLAYGRRREPAPEVSPVDRELEAALALLGRGEDEAAATRLQALLASLGDKAPPRLRWGLAVAFLARDQVPLALPQVGEIRGTRLPLRQIYQLAVSLERAGVDDEALRLYRSILSRDLHFRDVPKRVEALKVRADRLPSTVLRDLPARYSAPTAVGRGGMARVLAVTDGVLRRRVALKRPDSRVISEDELRKRFLREARALAMVVHPNVIRVFDVVAGEAPFYTMELHEGRTLAEVVAEDAPLTPERTLELTQPLAEALAACHGAGVIHRDLKPGNVLLDSEGRPVLADFGLAFTGEDTGITRTGLAPGTVAYMAPEQIQGHEPTPQFDVYAFGVLLHELLLGRRPDGEGPPTTPGGCPPELAKLLADCLSTSPKQRPEDGAALARRLATVAGTGRARDEDLLAFAGELSELVWGELHSLKNRQGVAEGGDAEVDGLIGRLRGMARPGGLGQGARSHHQTMNEALDRRDLTAAYGAAVELLRCFELNAFEVLDALVSGYRWKGSVRLEIGMPGPACRVADAALARRDLELAVANLIENAIEAGADAVEVRIDSMEPQQEATLVQVIDDGPGFSSEAREKVFRAPFSTRPEGGGTGLVTVGRICRRRGWSVGLAPGSPTNFRIILPAEPG